MRILLICNYKPGVGGISGQVEILQRKLREEGHTVDVFSTKASVWKRLVMLPKLRRTAKAYDVLHIHCCSGWGFLPAVLGVRAGNKLGKRVVLTYHGGGGETFFDKHPRLVQKYLTRTDANIVLSGFLAKVFEKHHLPYTIIPNIIELDASHFRRRETLWPCYICIRAHEELYNIPCILRAFQKVQKEIPDASLTLVGAGSLHESLVQQAKSMGLKNVVFTGRVDNSQIFEFLDQADVMISAPKIDNMPVSLLEAMSAGVLVISSRVGGVPYMIEHQKSGLLFDAKELENERVRELEKTMLWAEEHQEECVKMIEAAKEEVKKYSWSHIRKLILPLYEV